MKRGGREGGNRVTELYLLPAVCEEKELSPAAAACAVRHSDQVHPESESGGDDSRAAALQESERDPTPCGSKRERVRESVWECSLRDRERERESVRCKLGGGEGGRVLTKGECSPKAASDGMFVAD